MQGRGSFRLDRVFVGVGRISRASGTTDARLFKQLDQMLTSLHLAGRADVLAQVQSGTLRPLEVWAHFRSGKWHEIPAAGHLQPLSAVMPVWAETHQASPAHRRDRMGHVKALLVHARPGATLEDLPAVVAAYRSACEREGIGRTFNKARAAAQAFVRSTQALGKHDPIWQRISAIRVLATTPKLDRHPVGVAEAKRVRKLLGGEAGRIWWDLCTSGMGPKEYWEDGWERERTLGGLRIFGKKRKGRRRVVPLVLLPQRPMLTRDGMQSALRRLVRRGGPKVTLYVPRKSWTNWMVTARIPRNRRKSYLGHGGDITDLYERPELRAWLRQDAAALKRVLRA